MRSEWLWLCSPWLHRKVPRGSQMYNFPETQNNRDCLLVCLFLRAEIEENQFTSLIWHNWYTNLIPYCYYVDLKKHGKSRHSWWQDLKYVHGPSNPHSNQHDSVEDVGFSSTSDTWEQWLISVEWSQFCNFFFVQNEANTKTFLDVGIQLCCVYV